MGTRTPCAEQDGAGMSGDSLFEQLYEAAALNPSVSVLREAASHCSVALDKFITNPSDANLRALNGVWARGYRILADAAPPEPRGA